jgi:hypothetical protein
MAKRNDEPTRSDGATGTSDASGATTDNALQQRVLAFAEQLGRIAGTVHARAEGWIDRETLTKQIASVRDGAAQLLEHLARGMAETSPKAPAAAAAPGTSKGRSDGMVDAPGKKHRKPMPKDPRAASSKARTSALRAGKTMMKTDRLRGRG